MGKQTVRFKGLPVALVLAIDKPHFCEYTVTILTKVQRSSLSPLRDGELFVLVGCIRNAGKHGFCDWIGVSLDLNNNHEHQRCVRKSHKGGSIMDTSEGFGKKYGLLLSLIG